MFAIENIQNVEIGMRNKRQLASDPALCQGPARKCISMSQPGSQGALGRPRMGLAGSSQGHGPGQRHRGRGIGLGRIPGKLPRGPVAQEALEEEEPE